MSPTLVRSPVLFGKHIQLENHVIIKFTTHPIGFSGDATWVDQVSSSVLCKKSKFSQLLCHFSNPLKTESFIDMQRIAQMCSLGCKVEEAGIEARRHKFY